MARQSSAADVELSSRFEKHKKDLVRQLKRWMVSVGRQPSPTSKLNGRVRERLQGAFDQFDRNQKNENPLELRCRMIGRGGYLLSSGLDWDEPIIGKDNAGSKIKGMQWRTVIGWAGLEPLLEATFGGVACGQLQKAGALVEARGERFRLAPPKATSHLIAARRWVSESNRPAIVEYLDAGKGFSTEMLKQWLIEGNELKRNHELLGLTQAIRHSTAHGALSSTLVKNWGILPALPQLSELVAVTAVAILGQLNGAMNRKSTQP
jgi:hypothetical protein